MKMQLLTTETHGATRAPVSQLATRIDTQFLSQVGESESSKQLSDEVCNTSHEYVPELIIGKSTHFQSSRKVPKCIKKRNQIIKNNSVRFTCDADDMNIVEFNKLIIEHGKDVHIGGHTTEYISHAIEETLLQYDMQ